MSDKGTKKKLTRVEDEGTQPVNQTPPQETKPFVASDESKAQAKKLRIIAVISWVIAIALEVVAIILIRKPPITTAIMVWLIVLIVLDLIFAVIGSLMWKKSNRYDPASEKDKFRFFVQNQLGAIVSMIAFLPLVILIFTNKNMSGKQKGIAGVIGIVALLAAGFLGIDFNPPSQEDYTQKTEQVKELNQGNDFVYWTKSGKHYHLYQDCPYINTTKTDEIFQGTVVQAREKNIDDLCSYCEKRAIKEKNPDIPKTDTAQ
ncbi:MAG TPA: hypothetical protein PKN48_02095 [Bacteroidales bacterium]|nr:hypothetical protein [Bacteroidales bacterium]